MMTIDEAIKHCFENAKDCSKCSHEHLQLAKWLMELKMYRELIEEKKLIYKE